MNWVIVEVEESSPATAVDVIGPFETEHAAEMKRRERYFDRGRVDSFNTARWFRSCVREVAQP